MKKMTLIALVAAAAMCITSVASAAPIRDTRTADVAQKAMDIRDALSADQRAELVSVADQWMVIGDYNTRMNRVEADAIRIMGADTAAKFMDIVDPSIAYGGVYLKMMCVGNSMLGLLMSSVGAIGCTTETAMTAMVESYAAFIFANNCLLTGATNCESAMNAAGASAANWLSMFDSCDVADTAYYGMAATYAACGGTWE